MSSYTNKTRSVLAEPTSQIFADGHFRVGENPSIRGEVAHGWGIRRELLFSVLVAVGLEAGPAVGELPAARDDDHPDEV